MTIIMTFDIQSDFQQLILWKIESLLIKKDKENEAA